MGLQGAELPWTVLYMLFMWDDSKIKSDQMLAVKRNKLKAASLVQETDTKLVCYQDCCLYEPF